MKGRDHDQLESTRPNIETRLSTIMWEYMSPGFSIIKKEQKSVVQRICVQFLTSLLKDNFFLVEFLGPNIMPKTL
jgi:hypothetical protein